MQNHLPLFTDNSKVSIIGYGPVGQAQHLVFDKNTSVSIHDPDRGYAESDWPMSGFIFLCVPTPQSDDGSCDTSILEQYLSTPTRGIFVIRSTCPPAFLKAWEKKVRLVYMPEFLTERTWQDDAVNPIALVLGGQFHLTKTVYSFLKTNSIFRDNRYQFKFTDIEYACLLKYTANTWFATKVTLLNYMYQYCDANGLDYNKLEALFKEDPRIGPTHTQVPGPDGQYGFGGKCFPKDVSAAIKFFDQAGIDHKLLKQVVEDNQKFRND